MSEKAIELIEDLMVRCWEVGCYCDGNHLIGSEDSEFLRDEARKDLETFIDSLETENENLWRRINTNIELERLLEYYGIKPACVTDETLRVSKFILTDADGNELPVRGM